MNRYSFHRKKQFCIIHFEFNESVSYYSHYLRSAQHIGALFYINIHIKVILQISINEIQQSHYICFSINTFFESILLFELLTSSFSQY